MSRHTDDELYQLLTETGRLLRGVEPREGEEYSLESILAEFGQETAKPAPKPEEAATEDIPEQNPEPAPAPMEEEKPVEDPALLDTGRLRSTVAANMAKVMGPEKKMDGTPIQPGRKEKPASREEPVLRVVEGGKSETEKDPHNDIFPEEPEGMHKVPLEQVMSQTVESVLDEDDAILEPPVPLRERMQDLLADWGDRLSVLFSKINKKSGDETSPWDQPENEAEEIREEPEPEMDQAAREEKRLCKKDYTFEYEKIPSKALYTYRKAFFRNIDGFFFVCDINRIDYSLIRLNKLISDIYYLYLLYKIHQYLFHYFHNLFL